VETIIEFRYKLRMMGVPIQGPSQVLCDNKSVVLNTTLPSSTLKKKHNAIAYHRVREAVAAQIIKVRHIDGKDNIADILTKATDGPTFRKHLKAGLMSL
jgi:hypothetical protein